MKRQSKVTEMQLANRKRKVKEKQKTRKRQKEASIKQTTNRVTDR